MPEGMEGLLKQLVWEDVDEICTRCVAPVFGGKMIVVEISPGSGEYSAGIDLGGLCFRLIQDAYDDNGFRYSAPKNFGSIDAAKAAAQSDYTARVLSAVDPDEITRLRAALADAQAVGFAAGVEAAAKVAVAQAVYTRETIERATGSELVSNLVTVTKSKTAHDIETAIRALTPPDLTAAAARVLLGDENALRKLTFAYDREDAAQRGEPNPHTFIDLDAPDMGASWVNERIGCAVSALRAIAGDTP